MIDSSHLYPRRVFAARFHRSVHELHATQPIFGSRRQPCAGRRRRFRIIRRDQVGDVAVELGEAFEIAFRMAGGNARCRSRRSATAPAPPRAMMRGGSTERREAAGGSALPASTRGRPCRRRRAAAARSRCRARPGWPTACRARRSRSAAASAHCRRARGPARSVDRSAASCVDSQAADELGEVEGVRADVADAAAAPGARRVGAPRRLLLAVRLEQRRQPVLRVFDLHDAHRRRARRRRPSRAPAAPADSRCSCG